MALPATDNFNRADGGLGSNWTNYGSTNRIVSNVAQGPSTSADTFSKWNADTFADNQYAKYTIVSTNGHMNAGPAVHIGTSSINGYFLNTYDGNNGAYCKFVNGSFSPIAYLSSTIAVNDVVEIRATVSGSVTTLTGYKNGVALSPASTTDSSHVSGGAGFFIYDSAAQIDNWEGGNVGGATTHATTGSLANSGAAIAGTSAHIAIHTTTGVLSNSGSTIAGSASNFTPHATVGALATSGATVAGTSARFRAFSSTGVLSGAGAAIAGSSARLRAFSSTGALTNSGATIVGSALNFTPHDTTGVLSTGGATLSGIALNYTPHSTSGELVNSGAAINGSATHTVAGGVHPTDGALVAGGSAIAGTAAHIAKHDTTGALANDGAAIAGSATNYTVHSTTGALLADGALLSGAALHSFVTIHDTAGTLSGWGAEITGHAQNGTITESQHFSGNYGGYGSAKKKKKAKPNLVVDTVKTDKTDKTDKTEADTLESPELFIADALMASPSNIEETIEIEVIQPSEEGDRLHRYRILAAAALLTAH